MLRRSQRLDKKAKSKPKRDNDENIPTSDICHVCGEWGVPTNAACDCCPHSYHDECIDEHFRNRNFDTCEDLGYECDPNAEVIKFKFGEMVGKAIKSQCNRKPPKKRSARSNNKRKRKKSLGGSLNSHETEYKSLFYQNVEYKIGDDIVISMESSKGDWGCGRITKIYKKHRDTLPTFDIIWFWRATEVNELQLTNNEQMKQIQRGSEQDIRDHELNIDDNCYDDGSIYVDCLIDAENTSLALVVPSSEEYLQQIRSEKYEKNYYDVFWCTHAYNVNTKRKSLLPAGVIKSHQIIGITPARQNKKQSRSRKRNREQDIEESLQEAAKALMLSSVPKKLPCREKEHDEIERYMRNQISCYGQGSGLYISGMPGTGKTATVRQIARELGRLTVKKRGQRKSVLPEFEFHEINAMKLPTPKHLYTELAKKLLDRHYSPNTAVKKLESLFAKSDPNRKVCVLLVDELDYLLTRQQKVIYNIFDWPTKSNAKLVVIGIANTMDLPERLLPRVASRMGTTRVVFKAYQRDQLSQIIEERLEETKVFNVDAINYCAMAVAGVSGDCRTALQICRRAVEIAQKDIKENGISHLIDNKKNNKRARTNKKKKNNGRGNDDAGEEIVNLHHLKKAKDAFDQSNDVQIVSTLSIYEKLLLTGMVMHNTRNNLFAGTTDTYRRKFDNFVDTRLGEKRMKTLHFRNMLDRLKDMGIITITFEKKEWIEYIKFNIQIEEAAHALKENDICAKMISTLQTM